jgi:hypothetical protein
VARSFATLRLDIGFNSRYLLDIFEQRSGDTAVIRLAYPGSLPLIRDRDGSAALYPLGGVDPTPVPDRRLDR